MNPSVATVPRTAVNDARVGNIDVPKGSSIVCAMQAVRAPPTPFRLSSSPFMRTCLVYPYNRPGITTWEAHDCNPQKVD